MKIFIQTYGCTLNYSDSELMAGLLAEAGHKIVDSVSKADLIIVNSCTVKNSAEAKFFTFISKTKKPTIVAGCIPQAEKSLLKTKLKNYSIVGVDHITDIVHVVEETLAGNVVHLLDKKNSKRLNLPKIKRNKIIEIVPINAGCLGSCTYCKTKQARGNLVSYDKKAIINQIKCADAKEIWLTSQDTGAYGKDINSSLPELLREILKIKGDFKIRLGMCNPDFAYEYLNELIKIFKNKKMFRFLHVPVQAGNNRVLKNMNRNYKVRHYKKIVKKLRKALPDITISTDIIVGFPGETEKQFQGSIKLIQKTKPNVLNVSRFWSRPSTLASKMKQLNPALVKERTKRLTDEFKKFALIENKKWLGWEGNIIIDEKGKFNTMIGRNYAYKQIITKKKLNIGDVTKVKIKSVTCHDMRDFK